MVFALQKAFRHFQRRAESALEWQSSKSSQVVTSRQAGRLNDRTSVKKFSSILFPGDTIALSAEGLTLQKDTFVFVLIDTDAQDAFELDFFISAAFGSDVDTVLHFLFGVDARLSRH